MAIYKDGVLVSGTESDSSKIYLTTEEEGNKDFTSHDYREELVSYFKTNGYSVSKKNDNSYVIKPDDHTDIGDVAKTDYTPTSSENAETTVTGIMKKDSKNSVNAQNIQNLLLSKELDLKAEANAIELKKLNSMNEHNKLLASSQGISIEYVNSIKQQTKILDSLNKNIVASVVSSSELNKILNDKNMSPTINNTTNFDTSKLEGSTEAISESITEIKKFNEKISEVSELQKEEIEFNKNGGVGLLDTNGEVIKPREVKAKINAETLIEQTDMNNTTVDEFMDFVPDFLGGAFDDVGEELGVSDGMGLDFNPMDHILKILKKDSEFELKKEQGSQKEIS